MQTRELSFAERRDWLRLIRTQTVGPVAFRDLLRRYKTPAAALEALPQIIRRKNVSIPAIEQVEAEMEASERYGVRLLAACEPDYPPYLRAVDPCPPVISILGDVQHLHQPCVAIIGSRNASALGLKFAASMAHDLGQAGYTIVSGLARGIDASAHQACLPTGTAAVLGGVSIISTRARTTTYITILSAKAASLAKARWAIAPPPEISRAATASSPASPLALSS